MWSHLRRDLPILTEKFLHRHLFDDNKFDEIEIRFYKELLPTLIQFSTQEEISGKKCTANSLEHMVAKFYSGDYSLEKGDRGYYLVLEDLSNHYSMKKGPEGLNFQQINDILVKIAKFHSTTYAFNIKNPEIVKKWNLESWQEKTSNDPEFINLMENCMDNFIKDLKKEEPNLVKPVSNLKKRWDFLALIML